MTIASVYKAIANVSGALAKTGISKARDNAQQGYKFRGIDDVYNALAPILVEHGLVILPHVFSREVVERQTQRGGTLFYTTVGADFHFVAVADGSSHVVRTYGEAMDSGNKAMSAAYKYACMQAFCIPTEGDNDPDATTHEVAAKEPEGYANWLIDYESTADDGVEALKAAWTASPTAFRLHLVNTNKAKADAIKAKAASVKREAVPA
jgi:hypothetical protein